MNHLISLEAASDDPDGPTLNEYIAAARRQYEHDTANDGARAADAWRNAACMHWMRLMNGTEDPRALAVIAVALDAQPGRMTPAILNDALETHTDIDALWMRALASKERPRMTRTYENARPGDIPDPERADRAKRLLDAISQNEDEDHTGTALKAIRIIDHATGTLI